MPARNGRIGALAAALRAGGGDVAWRWFRAPGRVNLIGDHTDYNDGFVLPLAIDRACVIACAPRRGGRVQVRSLDVAGTVDVAADGSDDPASVTPSWGGFVAGVVRVLTGLGARVPGLEAAISSSVPVGSGLSSSAALEVALALAVADAAAIELSPTELAFACQEAEHLATGVPSGVMDQLASLLGRAGHALLIDCRSASVEPIPLPSRLGVLVVHSGLPRTLADSEYAERRAACEAVAARLGIAALRDATPEQVRDEPLGRHVVGENRRVVEFAHALRSGAVVELGSLLLASHTSLRDEYEVSTAELDLLVELLVQHGALGARLTGAGFGGCVVALLARERVDDTAAKVTSRYRAATGLEPSAFAVRAVDGAGAMSPARAP